MTKNTISRLGIAGRTGRSIHPNTVVRQACDRRGRVLGHFGSAHDGTPEGMVAAAKRVSDEMFLASGEVSNINSAILATDQTGAPRWTISPNFRVIEEVGPAA